MIARALVVGLLVLGVSGLARAQHQVFPLTVHPADLSAKGPSPRLTFDLVEQVPGNAADRYREAAAKYKQLAENRAEEGDWLAEVAEKPLAQVPVEPLREVVTRCAEVFSLLEQAARSESCDWGISDRLRKSGIGAGLQEVQDVRELARL